MATGRESRAIREKDEEGGEIGQKEQGVGIDGRGKLFS